MKRKNKEQSLSRWDCLRFCLPERGSDVPYVPPIVRPPHYAPKMPPKAPEYALRPLFVTGPGSKASDKAYPINSLPVSELGPGCRGVSIYGVEFRVSRYFKARGDVKVEVDVFDVNGAFRTIPFVVDEDEPVYRINPRLPGKVVRIGVVEI